MMEDGRGLIAARSNEGEGRESADGAERSERSEAETVGVRSDVIEFDSEHWVMESERVGVRRRLRAEVDGVSTGVRNQRGRKDWKSSGFSCSYFWRRREPEM